MRFELRSQEEDALNYLSRPKEQQRTTLRSHSAYQARTKHNGVGVAPSDYTGKFPATRTHMQRGVFCFHGREKG